MGGLIHNLADATVLIVLFSVTIFVHELCHFLVALRLGLVVDTFCIGFGPALWKRERRGITYKIGCIPFGGYVALPQLDPSAMEGIQGKNAPSGKSAKQTAGTTAAGAAARNLPEVSPWKRMIVAASGVVGNLFLAVILAWVVYLAPTAQTADNGTTIGYVDPESAAHEAGLRPGDQILSVNGESVRSWHDFTVACVLRTGMAVPARLAVKSGSDVRTVDVASERGEMGEYTIKGLSSSSPCLIGRVITGSSAERAGVEPGDIVLSIDGFKVGSLGHFIDLVGERGGKTVPLVVRRGSDELTLDVTPEFSESAGRALIGVELNAAELGILPWMRYKKPSEQLKGDATEHVRILRALVTPRESKRAANALGGPVMIITWLWVSIKISMFNAIGFLRFLNVNLAILNLLPIPVLDGGHIVFCLWEGVTRRKAHPKLVNALVNVFATLLIGVFVLLTFRDFLRAPRMFRSLRALIGNEPEQVDTNTVPAVLEQKMP